MGAAIVWHKRKISKRHSQWTMVIWKTRLFSAANKHLISVLKTIWTCPNELGHTSQNINHNSNNSNLPACPIFLCYFLNRLYHNCSLTRYMPITKVGNFYNIKTVECRLLICFRTACPLFGFVWFLLLLFWSLCGTISVGQDKFNISYVCH